MVRSPLVLFLFFLSGISALIFEIVWTRMLTLVFGHTVYSVSVVLAAYMAGLGLGGWMWGSAMDARESPDSGNAHRPLLVYGTFEILIGASGALLSLIFSRFADIYPPLYALLPESIWAQETLKAVLAFILMAVPATFMGATLPIVGKYSVTDDTRLGAQVGVVYCLNTLGAAAGCLLTGFFLISQFGVLQTALLASGLNLFVGIGAARIYQDATGDPAWFRLPAWSPPPALARLREHAPWLAAAFVCGFTALAYEVLWTRLLVFSISSTVYSFSIMLAVFLAGIALGGLLLSLPVLRRMEPGVLLMTAQAIIGLYVIFSLYAANSLLSPPWNSYNLQHAARALAVYLKDSSAIMLLPTLCFGISLPALVHAVAGGRENIGGAAGTVYAVNTLGGILGSLAAGFFLLPRMGSGSAFIAVATLNLLCALGLYRYGSLATPAFRKISAAALVAAVAFVNLAVPRDLLDDFFMRDSAGKRNRDKLLFFEEGLTDTVAVFADDYGILDPDAKRLITNGIPMSASNTVASRYMKLLAHAPILLSDRPEEVLVICFGTGQTVGAAGIHPRVKNVDAVDLSPGVFRSGKVFSGENHRALENPKIRVILQDGRNHLLTTRKQYDVITGEPPPPRTAFTVNLYTREYYELIRDRLRPGGLAVQWIPLHSQSGREIRMHFNTFLSVFPHAQAWMTVANEIMLIGSDKPIVPDFAQIRERMSDPAVRDALRDIRIGNPYSLLAGIWMNTEPLRKLAAGRPVISDNRPAIEFYLDFPDVIGVADKEQLLYLRLPFEDLARSISGMTSGETEELRRHYRAMNLYQRGVLYGNRRQLLEASALVEDNDLFRYHLQAGRDQVRRLAEALEREPGNTEYLLNLGHAFFQSGDYEKSVELLELARQKDPRQSYADLYSGYAFMEMGDRARAKTAFESAMKKNPSNLNAVMQEMALAGLLDKVERDPRNTDLLNAVAQLYNVKNDYLKSLEYSRQVLQQKPLDLQALQSSVFSYRGLGEAADLFDYATRYVSLNPDDPQIQYLLGELFAKTLQCEKAVPYLREVLKKDDSYRNADALLRECESAGMEG